MSGCSHHQEKLIKLLIENSTVTLSLILFFWLAMTLVTRVISLFFLYLLIGLRVSCSVPYQLLFGLIYSVCYFIKSGVCLTETQKLLVALVVSSSLQPHELQRTRFLCSRDFQGKNTGLGCHSLLQGIFPTQGFNPSLQLVLHCRQILYHLSHQGRSETQKTSLQIFL